MKFTQEQIDEINQKAEESLKFRIEINDNLNQQKSQYKRVFLSHFTQGLDKKSQEYKEQVKKYSNIFNMIHRAYYYDKDFKDNNKTYKDVLLHLLEQVQILVMWMRTLKLDSHLQDVLDELNMSIQTPELDLNEQDVDTLNKVFEAMKTTQTKICENSDMITIQKFSELPFDVKFNNMDNRSGMKSSKFNNLTTLLYKKMKNKDKAVESVNKLIDQININNESNDNYLNSAFTITKE